MPHTNKDNIISAYILIISSRPHADAARREIVHYFLVLMFVTDFRERLGRLNAFVLFRHKILMSRTFCSRCPLIVWNLEHRGFSKISGPSVNCRRCLTYCDLQSIYNQNIRSRLRIERCSTDAVAVAVYYLLITRYMKIFAASL